MFGSLAYWSNQKIDDVSWNLGKWVYVFVLCFFVFFFSQRATLKSATDGVYYEMNCYALIKPNTPKFVVIFIVVLTNFIHSLCQVFRLSLLFSPLVGRYTHTATFGT